MQPAVRSEIPWARIGVRAAIGICLGLTACRDKAAALDRQIMDLVRDHSRRLAEDAAPATLPPPQPTASDRSIVALEPATVNPAASELTYKPAPEDRDVAARLREFSRQEGLDVPPEDNDDPAAIVHPSARLITIEEALQQTQKTGREFLTAEEEYILGAIDLLAERHLWGPRLFNDTTTTLSGAGTDGDFQHAVDVVNTLRLAKRLPYGGAVEARWIWNATEQLREQATGRYTQSSSLVLSGEVPLLRGAGNVARESLIQAERNLVYRARAFERFRRSHLVDIARDYFDLLQTRSGITNQERQLASLRQFARATQARVDAGRLEAFETAITENRVKSAQASLANQREVYLLQLDRFKVRLGLPVDDVIDVSDLLPRFPEPDVPDLSAAAATALEYRLDLQNRRDQVDDTRRALVNARNGVLPDLDLGADVTLPTDPDDREGGVRFSPDDVSYSVGATLSLPLDRRIEELNVRSSQIRVQQAERGYEQLRDDVIVSVQSASRRVELARFQLDLAEQQVEINRRRLRAQKLKEDTIRPQEIVDTENDLLQAENDRDAARAALRSAVLQYLLDTDTLRVARDGMLLPLPGMDIRTPAPEPPVEQPPAPE